MQKKKKKNPYKETHLLLQSYAFFPLFLHQQENSDLRFASPPPHLFFATFVFPFSLISFPSPSSLFPLFLVLHQVEGF
ncbi:hypothetical protein Syun_020539 [Stephania yunnanensis]|uniref:Uncharacterized protein n=1 Tax=Stephania yunnanensis TaxID=152371 RepID=A0AAP0IEE9_9MAGN